MSQSSVVRLPKRYTLGARQSSCTIYNRDHRGGSQNPDCSIHRCLRRIKFHNIPRREQAVSVGVSEGPSVSLGMSLNAGCNLRALSSLLRQLCMLESCMASSVSPLLSQKVYVRPHALRCATPGSLAEPYFRPFNHHAAHTPVGVWLLVPASSNGRPRLPQAAVAQCRDLGHDRRPIPSFPDC